MLPIPLSTLARRQHGVVSLDQARESGLSLCQIRTRIRIGLLDRPTARTLRLSGAPVTWHQAVAVAVLSVPGSLASHRTAAALHRLDGFHQERIEVVTEQSGWRHRDFTIHRTKDLVAADISRVSGIPCTSLIRTLVDLPAVTNEFRAGKALDHAIRTDRSVLRSVLRRHLEVARRGRNGTVALRAMLERRGDGTRIVDSGFEDKALDLIERARLPKPIPQWEVRDDDFVTHLDLAWPDRMVGVECDSLAHHFGEDAHQWDRTRRRRLKLLGWSIYEYTYDDVVRRPGTVIRELRQVLGEPSPPPPPAPSEGGSRAASAPIVPSPPHMYGATPSHFFWG